MGDAAEKLDDMLDERIVPRARVHVDINLYSEHNFWTGLTMNVSEGGVFVATHLSLAIGTLLVVYMTLPGEKESLVALAEVRWTRAFTNQDDVPPGVGLQFVALDEQARRKIRRFVANVRDPLFFDD